MYEGEDLRQVLVWEEVVSKESGTMGSSDTE